MIGCAVCGGGTFQSSVGSTSTSCSGAHELNSSSDSTRVCHCACSVSGRHVLVVWCLDLSESVAVVVGFDCVGGVGVGVVCSVPGWTELRRRHCLQSHLFLLCCHAINQFMTRACICVSACVPVCVCSVSDWILLSGRLNAHQHHRFGEDDGCSGGGCSGIHCCVLCVSSLARWLAMAGWLQRVRRAPTTRWSTNRAPARASVSLVFALICACVGHKAVHVQCVRRAHSRRRPLLRALVSAAEPRHHRRERSCCCCCCCCCC